MQTPKNSSWFEFETSDSTEWRRRSGPESLQKLGWITSVSGQTDEARCHVHSQHSVQTHEWTYQSTLDVTKTLLQYFQGWKDLKFTYTKEASYDLVGKVLQTGLVTWTTENKRRATTSNSTDVAQHSTGVSRSRPQMLFLHQKQNIRVWQQQFKKIVSETTPVGFRHPTETSNSNWRGQPELY